MKGSQIPLHMLPVGKKANVVMLNSDCASRRRLLDLGIIEGTVIEKLFKSPSGSPEAYMIRGAVIALRSDISDRIIVSFSGNS